MTKEELIAFEQAIAADFEAGLIKAPVHFSGGNEEDLIEIFERVRPQDWVLGTWRMHYQCLLKGVPPEQLKKAIHEGRSISLAFPEHRILSSGIVGGIAPIAVGLAWSIKRSGLDERVFCFMGDMSAETGIVNECFRYAAGFNLPIDWVIENNGLSVCTPTTEVWGRECRAEINQNYCTDFAYKLTWPHVGTGKWVRF